MSLMFSLLSRLEKYTGILHHVKYTATWLFTYFPFTMTLNIKSV